MNRFPKSNSCLWEKNAFSTSNFIAGCHALHLFILLINDKASMIKPVANSMRLAKGKRQ